MLARVLVGLAVTAASAVQAAAPIRYVPAPPGKFYYMLYATGNGYGDYTISEVTPIAGHPATGDHNVKSEWTTSAADVGITAGVGLGKVWFIPSVDLSAYIPFYMRSFELQRYLVTSDPVNQQALYAYETLHASVKEPESGSGVGDATLSALGMVYGDNAGGTWIASTVRVSLATGVSAHEQFARILHGENTAPAAGDGVARIIPAISMLKVIGGQRAYIDIEYAQPLSSRERFSFTSPVRAVPAGERGVDASPYTDSNMAFDEVIKPAGIVLGTIGVETSLDLLGVIPGLEVNVRNYQAASWQENGKDGLAPSEATSELPTHTPAFLETGAWTIGNLPLRSVTEIEVALIGTARFRAGNALKFGVSYITGTFGSSLGFRISFVNLFIERPLSDRGVPGKPEAREVEVAPVIEAPLAPSKLVKTGVSFPMFVAGVSQEEAGWVAGQLRAGMRRLRSYEVMSEKDMEQLAYEPCGDADCGTRYARALKLQAYVVSRLEKAGSGFSLGVQMINVADGTVAASDSVSAASLEELRGQIPVILDRLTKPAAPVPPAPPR